MTKTPQEIVETYGKTVDIAFTYGTKAEEIGSVASEKINEVRYYFDGALYTSVMRCMEIKLIGNFSETIKKDYLIRAMNITVNSPDGDYFNISLNNFHVAEEPEYNAEQNLTSIITYDNMYLTMQPYDMALDWTNGITLKSYLTSILGKLGMQYNEASLNLMANADKLITSEKFIDIENDDTESAYTYRDVLDEIAKASGVSFCYKNTITGRDINSFQLYAVKPTESGIVIDESNLKSVTIGAEYGPVKGVVLSREPQEDNIYYPSVLTENDTAVKISNVEIIEDAEDNTYREKFIQGIYSNVVGTQYYLYDLDSFGILILNFGDIFTIKACDRMDGTIGEEKSYKTILMRTDITIGDGISEKSKLEAPQATSTDYSAASTTDKTLKKTMLKVDKQNQKITGYIKDADGKYSLLEQTVEGFRQEIEDPENGLKAQLTATAAESKSQYEALEKKIEKDFVSTATYNSYIEQTAKEIKLHTESIKKINDAGYITETQAQSMIDLQEDNITLSVEKNLKIGARNILLDSACFAGLPDNFRSSDLIKITLYDDTAVPSGSFKDIAFSPRQDGNVNDDGTCTNPRGFYYSSSSLLGQIYREAVYTLTSDTEVSEYKRYYTRSGSEGSYVYSYVESPTKDDLATYYELTQEAQRIDKIKPNTTYALSWWMRWGYSLDKPDNFRFNDVLYFGAYNSAKYNSDKCIFPGFSPAWQRYVIVFTTPAKITDFWLRFFFDKLSANTDYSVHISSLKLEEGNIATDWTPSETDLVSNATYNSFIKLLPQKISLGVTETVTDSYVAEKIHSKCVSVELDINGFTINNGAFTLKDDEGEIMIDSTGIHSEYLNFGKTIDMETIKNGKVIDANDVDIWTLRNYTGSKTGMLNAKAAVSIMSNIPALKTLFWNNSNNWFCHNSSTNSVTIANIDSVEETQTYILTFDVILATTTNGKALLPQQIILISDKGMQYDVGVDNLTSGSATVSDKTYQYRYGTLSCSIRGYDLIKIRGGRSDNAKLRINLMAISNFGASNDSLYWLKAMYSPTTDNMAFVGNIKLKTFVGATLNARALLNSNTDYFFDLGTGIISADEIGCKNLRAVSIPTSTTTDTLKKLYIDETTGQLYREM